MKTSTQESQLTKFAEQVYIEQKDTFIHDLTEHLKNRIESGLAQFKDGKYMGLEESRDRINEEFFNKLS